MWQRDLVRVLQGVQLVGGKIAQTQGVTVTTRLQQIQRHSKDLAEKASSQVSAKNRVIGKKIEVPLQATSAQSPVADATPSSPKDDKPLVSKAKRSSMQTTQKKKREIPMRKLDPPPVVAPGETTTDIYQKPKINGIPQKLKDQISTPSKHSAPESVEVPSPSTKSDIIDAVSGEISPPEEVSREVDLARTRAVPSTPLARVLGFGQLAAGLAFGTVAEAVKRSVQAKNTDDGASSYSPLVSDANAERLASALCKMRGAALKLGQMLSIQDEGVIPPPLAKALERVRQGADLMPSHQLHQQLSNELGEDWHTKLKIFDEHPIAAASIGQVHQAVLLDGQRVAMKIQYPGVADSIESDLKNLKTLVTLTNILPPGLFVDEIIDVGKEELIAECNYESELQNQLKFKDLVESDPVMSQFFEVPGVIEELSSKQVLTSQYVEGLPIDKALDFPQEVRNNIARSVLELTIKELFEWNFMQTDPNWGNFLYNHAKGKTALIDFGASRAYDKSFVDGYLSLVWSAAERDEETLLQISKELGFLTGDESAEMLDAHSKAGMVVGEPFINDEPFDFHGSQITKRLQQYGDTFMKHRLTPPPREAYSLHRKLAGAFLMCIKLKAVIPCRDILQKTVESYTFLEEEELRAI